MSIRNRRAYRHGQQFPIAVERRKVNLSKVFAGQQVGVRQVTDRIWLVSFMDYDLGYL